MFFVTYALFSVPGILPNAIVFDLDECHFYDECACIGSALIFLRKRFYIWEPQTLVLRYCSSSELPHFYNSSIILNLGFTEKTWNLPDYYTEFHCTLRAAENENTFVNLFCAQEAVP